LIKVTKPKGNSSKGSFANCEDLTDDIKDKFIERFEIHKDNLQDQLKGLEEKFWNVKASLNKEEEKLSAYYKGKIAPLEGKTAPRTIEKRIMLKRERKQRIGDFTKKRDKKLNPLEKEIKTKRDNVVPAR
jgi:hypothetical protein